MLRAWSKEVRSACSRAAGLFVCFRLGLWLLSAARPTVRPPSAPPTHSTQTIMSGRSATHIDHTWTRGTRGRGQSIRMDDDTGLRGGTVGQRERAELTQTVRYLHCWSPAPAQRSHANEQLSMPPNHRHNVCAYDGHAVAKAVGAHTVMGGRGGWCRLCASRPVCPSLGGGTRDPSTCIRAPLFDAAPSRCCTDTDAVWANRIATAATDRRCRLTLRLERADSRLVPLVLTVSVPLFCSFCFLFSVPFCFSSLL